MVKNTPITRKIVKNYYQKTVILDTLLHGALQASLCSVQLLASLALLYQVS